MASVAASVARLTQPSSHTGLGSPVFESSSARYNEGSLYMPPAILTDRLGRPLRNLRLSVTDRCNLRCEYCMPQQDYTWLPREDLLNFEEISRLVDVFIDGGVRKVRLTGGEPLLRKDLARLIEEIAAKPRLEDLAMTTKGRLL